VAINKVLNANLLEQWAF